MARYTIKTEQQSSTSTHTKERKKKNVNFIRKRHIANEYTTHICDGTKFGHITMESNGEMNNTTTFTTTL